MKWKLLDVQACLPDRRARGTFIPCTETSCRIISEYKKTERTKGLPFGSSAIFNFKTRDFPPPSCKGFGFVGKQLCSSL
jgi:hypothetical protein